MSNSLPDAQVTSVAELATPPTEPGALMVRRLKRETRVAIGVAALATALTVLGGLEAQREIQEARIDVQKQVADLDATARQAKALAEQFQNSNHDLESRLTGVEGQLTNVQTQQVALEALYRDLSINREDGVLAEVEQAVSIASQELLLAGDVRSAIRAMETASRRMERLNRPSLLNLRRIIEQDLRRLRSVPLIDVAGMSLRIDGFAGVADSLPLAAYARPGPPPRRDSSVATGFWGRIGEQLVGELGQAVRLQRTDGPELAPLVPEQSFFLRQTLKLRLLTARQALLARDETTYRSDLRMAARWVDSYYDRQDRAVQKMSEALHQMADASMAIGLPGVETSLAAVRDIRSTSTSSAR
jgi:uroporphyrin-3 C-methyltransferase